QPAANDYGTGLELVAWAAVGALRIVIEPVDERVLIDQAFVHELVGALDGKRAVPPRPVSQNDAADAPSGPQLFKLQFPTHPGEWHVSDIREVEAFVDFLVFVLALLDVPTRQSVLDFSVRTGVLLEDDNQGAALRENSRDFGPRSRSPDDCNYVP